jgi:hypothetical protein
MFLHRLFYLHFKNAKLQKNIYSNYIWVKKNEKKIGHPSLDIRLS